jgi:hypothetical protein
MSIWPRLLARTAPICARTSERDPIETTPAIVQESGLHAQMSTGCAHGVEAPAAFPPTVQKLPTCDRAGLLSPPIDLQKRRSGGRDLRHRQPFFVWFPEEGLPQTAMERVSQLWARPYRRQTVAGRWFVSPSSSRFNTGNSASSRNCFQLQESLVAVRRLCGLHRFYLTTKHHI